MSTAHAFVTDAYTPVASPPVRPAPPSPTAVSQAVPAAAAVEPLGQLPAEWERMNGVAIGDDLVDVLLIGPNGLFAVHLDTDPRPAAVRPGAGLFRAGAREPLPVKRALRNADALRSRLAHLPGDLFPYPVLVTSTPGESGQRLGRLLVVRPGRLPEAIWRHVSRPLRRSERLAIRQALQS